MKEKKALMILAGLATLTLTSCGLFDKASSNSTDSAAADSSTPTSKTNPTGNLAATKQSTKYTYQDIYNSQEIPSFPHTGTAKMLVLPITVKGYESNATASNKAAIQKTLFGGNSSEDPDVGWESLSSYYKTSSFGNLNIQGTVADWYACGLEPSEIVTKNDRYASEVASIITSAVAAYKQSAKTSCAEFDNDKDGYLDGVMAIYSCPNMSSSIWSNDTITEDPNQTLWAFTYNCYDSEGYPLGNPSTSSPIASKYFWASYDFMFEGYGSNKLDAHTFIHESGHMMGLDDYYDYGRDADGDGKTDYVASPMGGIDMMDLNIVDHNAFSKFSLGWVKPYVVTGNEGSLSLTLKPSATNSDSNCVIFPTGDGWNGSAFDEYIMMEYYTPTGLNESDATVAYSTRPKAMTQSGVRIYHVDARMIKEVYNSVTKKWSDGGFTDGVVSNSTTMTEQAFSNTKEQSYDSTINLIQELDHKGRNFAKEFSVSATSYYVADNDTLWQNGDSFNFSTYASQFPKKTTMDDGTAFPYQVAFSGASTSGITLTITAA